MSTLPLGTMMSFLFDGPEIFLFSGFQITVFFLLWYDNSKVVNGFILCFSRFFCFFFLYGKNCHFMDSQFVIVLLLLLFDENFFSCLENCFHHSGLRFGSCFVVMMS